jgi:uncharacterized protein with PQ loop repeat
MTFHDLRTNRKLVEKTPIITTCLLEFANFNQLWRMWTTQTADGQSLWGWMYVNLALVLWLNFYLVFNREQKFAIWGTTAGIGINALVILTVIWFRYIVG